MKKQGDTRPASKIKEKVLTEVSAFFDTLKYLRISRVNTARTLKTMAKQTSKSNACFKLKIEHENLCRNTPNNDLLYHGTDQQPRGVASKCSVWW